MKKRVLLLDEKTERALTAVCDTALRFAGMYMATLVADVATAIRDVQEGEDFDW